jgi:hypothetical protein
MKLQMAHKQLQWYATAAAAAATAAAAVDCIQPPT